MCDVRCSSSNSSRVTGVIALPRPDPTICKSFWLFDFSRLFDGESSRSRSSIVFVFSGDRLRIVALLRWRGVTGQFTLSDSLAYMDALLPPMALSNAGGTGRPSFIQLRRYSTGAPSVSFSGSCVKIWFAARILLGARDDEYSDLVDGLERPSDERREMGATGRGARVVVEDWAKFCRASSTTSKSGQCQ